ncbi:MAG: SurA N-terminal domain-containing protein [Pseudomonadota bacterium]
MSVLEKIRAGTESGTMRVILGIIVVVFVFWGIGTGGGPTSTVIATVNGERITDSRFQATARRMRDNRDAGMTEDQVHQYKMHVLNGIIQEMVLLQEADDCGIQVSDDEVAVTILDIPAFQDEDGAFSEELYIRYLKSNGSTKGQFETDIRNSLVIGRLREMAAAAVRVDDEEIRERWNQEMTSFSLELVAVRPVDFFDDFAPTDVELETFIAENRPEIRAWYDEHYATRFHKPLRARARTILLQSSDDEKEDAGLAGQADKIKAEFEAGTDFAMLARKYSEDITAESGGLLGEVRYDQLDPAIGNAIFGTDTSPLRDPGLRRAVRTDRGLQLVYVEEILPEETTEEQDARPEIARTLLKEHRAPELAAAYAERVRAAWAASPDGMPPIVELAEQNMRVEQAGPLTLADPGLEPYGVIDALTAALRASTGGEVLPAVIEAPEAWLVVRVLSRTEPDPARYARELPALRPRIEMLKRMEFVGAWADDLVARARVKQLVQL